MRNRILGRISAWQKGGAASRLVVAGVSPPPLGAVVPDRARAFILLSGCRHVRIAGTEGVRDIYLRRGDVLFCPRESWHQVIPDRRYALICLIFDRNHTSAAWKTSRPGKTLHSVAPPILSPATRHVLQALETEEEEGPQGAALINALIALAGRDLERVGLFPDRSRAAWLRLREHIEENFRAPINRDSVARAFNLHPNHISRLFRQHEGTTFSSALSGLRLAEGARLLRDTALPVKEVAVQCGFESSNYFGKVFRRAYGTSPGKFRSGERT